MTFAYLDRIAFQVATSDFLGPPSGIAPLIYLHRDSPHLYLTWVE
jgi:hypothetical protein